MEFSMYGMGILIDMWKEYEKQVPLNIYKLLFFFSNVVSEIFQYLRITEYFILSIVTF